MKSKLLIFPLLLVALGLLLLSKSAKAQTIDWQSISLNNIVKVSFPGQPEDKSITGQNIHRLRLADSTATLITVVIDLSASGLSAEQYSELAQTDEFWQQVKQGIIQQMGNTQLIKEKLFRLQGISALSMELKRDDGQTKDTIYQVLFVKGLSTYIFSFNSRNGKGNLKIRDQFFESIKIQ